jgi:hypothetical protein
VYELTEAFLLAVAERKSLVGNEVFLELKIELLVDTFKSYKVLLSEFSFELISLHAVFNWSYFDFLVSRGTTLLFCSETV